MSYPAVKLGTRSDGVEGGPCRSPTTCARSRAPAGSSSPHRRSATASSTRPHRRTSPRSSACSAACCSPRTPSPTSSRSCESNDFYRPAHATIFDAILDLYGRGEPADPITVAAALADSGDLARVGGAPYLHTLIASVPTAANAAYYARIVERAGRAAPPGRGRHEDRPARLRHRGRRQPRRRRHRRPRPAGRLRRHRAAGQRGLRGPRRHAPADARRDRGGRAPRAA